MSALKTGDDDSGEFVDGPDCYCPSDCTETIYSTEMSQATLRDQSHFFDDVRGHPNYKKLSDGYNNATRDKTIAEEERSNLTDPNSREYAKLTALIERLNATMEELSREKKGMEDDMSLVHIYFKELGIVQYSRDQLYSIIDVIAACGGLVGLCTGFSILSGAEVIYFFTLRFFVDLYRRKKARKEEKKSSGKKRKRKTKSKICCC